MKIQVFLQGLEIDSPEGSDIIGVMFFHQVTGALNHPANPGFSNKHVMSFFGQHESAGS